MADMMLPGGARGKARGHGGHAAQAVNLDTGTHVDSRGNPHKTHPGNKAHIGPDTLIFAQGHPAMPFHHHAMNKTALHKRMTRRANPHPDAIMQRAIPALPGGNQAAPLLPPGAVAPDAPMPFALPGGRVG